MSGSTSSSDPDETEGRRLYRAAAETLARAQVAIASRRVEMKNEFCCLDCGVDTLAIGQYPLMIRDELWEQIVPGGEGHLCLADMERRLGRLLTENDCHPYTGPYMLRRLKASAV